MTDFHTIQNLRVEEFTTPSPVTLAPDTPVSVLFNILDNYNIRHIPIVEDKEIIGLISEREINKMKLFRLDTNILARDVMSLNVQYIHEDTLLLDASYKMSQQKIGSLLVINSDGDLSGIFTTTDALNALVEILRGDILSLSF